MGERRKIVDFRATASSDATRLQRGGAGSAASTSKEAGWNGRCGESGKAAEQGYDGTTSSDGMKASTRSERVA
eukprot:1469167-Pleurochrysis_carterae.AAC.1